VDKSKTVIILVHGLWNSGRAMSVMAARLRSRGHPVAVFSYPSRGNNLQGHAKALHEFIGNIKTDKLHLVGHSLGGLVILKLLSCFDDMPPGRVVLMGSPVRGSRAAGRLEDLPGLSFLFGKIGDDLAQGFWQTPDLRETGVICGTRSIGLGRMTGRLNEANDGSVGVSETELNGLKDGIVLPVAHTQMLVSALVVDQLVHFLLHGRFSRETEVPA